MSQSESIGIRTDIDGRRTFLIVLMLSGRVSSGNSFLQTPFVLGLRSYPHPGVHICQLTICRALPSPMLLRSPVSRIGAFLACLSKTTK